MLKMLLARPGLHLTLEECLGLTILQMANIRHLLQYDGVIDTVFRVLKKKLQYTTDVAPDWNTSRRMSHNLEHRDADIFIRNKRHNAALLALRSSGRLKNQLLTTCARKTGSERSRSR